MFNVSAWQSVHAGIPFEGSEDRDAVLGTSRDAFQIRAKQLAISEGVTPSEPGLVETKTGALVARNIRRLRVARGLSHEALAVDAQIVRTYVSRGNPALPDQLAPPLA